MSGLNNQKRNNSDFAHSYSLYKYFKKNPGVLGVIISAITACSSFLFDVILSISTNRYLAFWHMDMYSIKAPTSSMKYYLVLALAIQFVVAYITLQITPLLYSSAYFQAVLLQEREKLNQIIRVIHKIEHDYAQAKKKITDPNFQSEIKNKRKQLLSDKQQAIEIDKSIMRKIFLFRLGFLGQCCLIYIILFIVSLYLFSFGSNSTQRTTAIFLFPLGILIINIILCYAANPSVHIRNIKKELNNAEFIDSLKSNSEGVIEKALSLGFKSQLSNERILGLFKRIIITVLIFATGILIPTAYMPSKKADFPIIMFEDKTYAIISVDEQNIYAEEAYVNGNSISINTSKHKIFEKKDIDAHIYHFETVNILSEP